MLDALKRYARQPSTWRGLAILLAMAGITIEPGLLEQVGIGVAAAIGIGEVVMNERKS